MQHTVIHRFEKNIYTDICLTFYLISESTNTFIYITNEAVSHFVFFFFWALTRINNIAPSDSLFIKNNDVC